MVTLFFLICFPPLNTLKVYLESIEPTGPRKGRGVCWGSYISITGAAGKENHLLCPKPRPLGPRLPRCYFPRCPSLFQTDLHPLLKGHWQWKTMRLQCWSFCPNAETAVGSGVSRRHAKSLYLQGWVRLVGWSLAGQETGAWRIQGHEGQRERERERVVASRSLQVGAGG